MLLDEQVTVLEEVADFPLDSLLAPGRVLCRLGGLGPAPRQLGGSGGQPLPSWARAVRIALVSSRRMWKVQSWCGTSPKTAAIGSGYSDEPSVVIPLRVSPRTVRAPWNRRKKAVMSVWSGS